MPTTLQYQSAISGYQPYADQALEPWRQSNERVARIGGWRAYAREAATGEPAQETPASIDPHRAHHEGEQR